VSSPRLLRQELEDYENAVKKHRRLIAAYNKKVEAYNEKANEYNDNIKKDGNGDPLFLYGSPSALLQWNTNPPEPVTMVHTMYKSGDSWYVNSAVIGITYNFDVEYSMYPLFDAYYPNPPIRAFAWELVERINARTAIVKELYFPYTNVRNPGEFTETEPTFKLKPPDFTAAQLKKLYQPSSALGLAASMRISGGFIDAVLSYKPRATIRKISLAGSDFSYGGEGEGG
jgi:hypothetical protein